ncbi:MAG: rRNA maturation RNase YbeY [Rhodobacterales bacterium]|nr:rRNA maturation RNase YbeY [Puniceibacterium antarcticum]
MLTDTLIEDDRWRGITLESLAEVAARATLAHLAFDPDHFEIALLACDDARIAVLNADFRDKPVATNVLSWPAWDLSAEDDGETPEAPEEGSAEDPESLGDIAISWDTCAREAAEAGKPLSDHVSHLIVHGVLHLLGYDHIRDGDATLMEGHETAILGKMGIDDPYRDH